ncbi:autoinducer binding domain-containing protein [Salipiger sp. H15]|uniref:Autoinducer binding domain-containing protein n=1 Tax=Alloyangia sp. H15 TaxID=3029062 RepID=A0AAU8AC01_9RHOB
MPELLQWFLAELEATRASEEVWRLLVRLGRRLELPCVDFVIASGPEGPQRALIQRASYDTGWLAALDPSLATGRWSYLRGHSAGHLTPIAVGIEFLDEYHPLPEGRVELLREAARHGLRAGFSIPLRQTAPPRFGQLSFAGDHGRREMLAIIHAHGWVLNVAALTGHQRFLGFYAQEFPDRQQITGKQRELLAMIGAGLKDKQIAERLGISVSAVRQRLQALCERTGKVSRAELAALAMSLGVLPDPLLPHGPAARAEAAKGAPGQSLF